MTQTVPVTPVATPQDLSTYLGSTVDNDRATLLLLLAQGICQAYANPLPDAAKAVVLGSAARAYVNPQQTTAETVGPYTASSPFPGLYLTRQERQILKTLAGRGGAFTIDPTPADAGTGLMPWDLNVWWGPGGWEAGYLFDEPNEIAMWY